MRKAGTRSVLLNAILNLKEKLNLFTDSDDFKHSALFDGNIAISIRMHKKLWCKKLQDF